MVFQYLVNMDRRGDRPVVEVQIPVGVADVLPTVETEETEAESSHIVRGSS